MVLLWPEVHRMVMSRLGKRSAEKLTPEERSERARHAVSKRKWRAVKTTTDDTKKSGLKKVNPETDIRWAKAKPLL